MERLKRRSRNTAQKPERYTQIPETNRKAAARNPQLLQGPVSNISFPLPGIQNHFFSGRAFPAVSVIDFSGRRGEFRGFKYRS